MGQEKAIIELTKKVRRAQTEYFADRTKTKLIIAKELEAKLDRELRRYDALHSD